MEKFLEMWGRRCKRQRLGNVMLIVTVLAGIIFGFLGVVEGFLLIAYNPEYIWPSIKILIGVATIIYILWFVVGWTRVLEEAD